MVRYFFQAGAAAGTIAKTMSAYDKVVSQRHLRDGAKRALCLRELLYKMLDHEWKLMEKRLRPQRPDTNFFVFAIFI